MVTVIDNFLKERIQVVNNTKTTSLSIKELKRREGEASSIETGKQEERKRKLLVLLNGREGSLG